MSWWSDGERFDEFEGCEKCNFNKRPSKKTCDGCKSGDKWNKVDWDEPQTERSSE